MSTNEANKDKLPLVFELNNQSVLITGDVENNPSIADGICTIEELDNFIRGSEGCLINGIIPKLKGGSGIRMFIPKCTKRPFRKNAHR